MNTYRFCSEMGVDMGNFQGESPEDALEAMYEDGRIAEEHRTPLDEWDWQELEEAEEDAQAMAEIATRTYREIKGI